ncbi:aspartate carbamoyltransferase catalytic subunit [Propionibacterium cyclohexanicum]|uniref:Aspartate carbamoyltransferase n=1 Tax=Propionibacterium cyclohexanicum TaxID=64702 RepID=A0A1H9RHK4_9ACTN|nr:aspartate carbamoyltransferase [Propionibacterium cyclohexanicum]SER72174.1 aspartate carbamoyltransferase catalytic subunit [Propionibacterium cyclohexanicum]
MSTEVTNPPSALPPFDTGQHLLSVSQLDRAALTRLFAVAESLRPVGEGRMVCRILEGAVLGSLFFEPSTRTRLSFESAFRRLGGSVVSTTGFTFSSMAKGESIHDTARVVSGYSDAMVVRHPDTGSVAQFAQASVVPVINAGDGSGEHPSQSLLDLFTMREELSSRDKSIDGATIAVLGDLRYGRTVHSLLQILGLYDNVSFRVFGPPALALPSGFFDLVASTGNRIVECDSVDEAIAPADVIYCTRVQKERLSEEDEQAVHLHGDLLNTAILQEHASPDAIVMHPLPRDSRHNSFDLSPDVDGFPGLAIFRQTDNGLLVRMAIFSIALGVADRVADELRPATWRRR